MIKMIDELPIDRPPRRRRPLLGLLLAGLCLPAIAPIALSFARSDAASSTAGESMSANPGSSEGASGMNQASKAQVFHDVVRKLAAGEHLDPALLTRFANAQN